MYDFQPPKMATQDPFSLEVNRLSANLHGILDVLKEQPAQNARDDDGNRCIQEKVKIGMGAVILLLNQYAATGEHAYVRKAIEVYNGMTDGAFLDCFFASPNNQGGRIENRERVAKCKEYLCERKEITINLLMV